MASKEYWDELFKRFENMSDDEFAALVEQVQKEPPLFAIAEEKRELTKRDKLALKEQKLKRNAVACSVESSSPLRVTFHECLPVPREVYAEAAKIFYTPYEALKKKRFRDGDVLFRLSFSFPSTSDDTGRMFEGRIEYKFSDMYGESYLQPYVVGIVLDTSLNAIFRLKDECIIAPGEEAVFENRERNEEFVVDFCW